MTRATFLIMMAIYHRSDDSTRGIHRLNIKAKAYMKKTPFASRTGEPKKAKRK